MGIELVQELSQFFTPRWLAKMLAWHVFAAWEGGYILEPHCGNGALVRAMVDAGIPQEFIVANDIDPRMARLVREEFPGVKVFSMDAANLPVGRGREIEVELVVDNPPYEGGRDIEAIERGMRWCDSYWGILRSEVEHQVGFHEKVMRNSVILWQALCVGRPSFECGMPGNTGMFETMAINLAPVEALALGRDYRAPKEYWRKPTSR